MSNSDCCQKGFDWEGTPVGKEGTLAKNSAYITGSNKDLAILFVADLFGWTYPNNRILADHYAKEVGATVYVPDFFGGEVKPVGLVEAERFEDLDMPTFVKVNSKEVRGPEILDCARQLKAEYKRVIACGFCYGGWACFRLGAKGENLVDAISIAHPSWLTKEEIDAIGVPVQAIAPQHDPTFTPELKSYFVTKLSELNLPFAYEYFPNVKHAFATRGDKKNSKVDREALERAKNTMVSWFKQWGHPVQGN